MASQGPLYPGTVTTEIGPSGDNDWLNASNVGANDGSEAQITAATYDAGDHSYVLKASNFGFTIPAGATVNGIVVEIERRAFAGAAEDQEVRLMDEGGAAVGDDKQTAAAWPTTVGVATYGSSSDIWGWTTVTAAKINDPDWGLRLIALATAANTDIGVDFIRVTVHYTESTNRSGEVSWAEVEVPTAPRAAELSWAEIEVPTAPRSGEVSWAELEVPTASRLAELSWAELEVPLAPRAAEVSWAEIEIPSLGVSAEVSWAEVEVPTASRGAEVSWVEIEIPNAPRAAELSWAEVEVPTIGGEEYPSRPYIMAMMGVD